jgi:NAD(P)-dependent dehydrogenase (short-subunit alcohol dehydrogenase family)
MRLKNKVAIITGAGSGIGRASALMFAKEGAKVVVSDIDDRGGQETVDSIRLNSGEAIYVHADVAVASDVKHLIKVAVDTFGKIDVLFNNAGYYVWPHGLEAITEEEFDRSYAVNVKGIFWGAKFVVPEMKKAGGGVIINTASMSAVRPKANAAYASSKSAVIGLSKSLAFQLAPHNIRVNIINPVATETPLLKKFLGAKTDEQLEEARKQRLKAIPLGRTATPEDIAYAAVYLASDESRMLTGDAINVDGGTGL